MTGIYAVRAIFYVLMIAVSGGFFLYTIFAGGLTWLKASDAGILQFHRLFRKWFYWFYYLIVIVSISVSVVNFVQAYAQQSVLKETEIEGIQAFLTYEASEESVPVELETDYFILKTQEYLRKINHHQQNGFFYLFMGMLWFSMMMLNTGFITKKGYYPLGSFRPKRLYVKADEGELCFYLTNDKNEKPLLVMKDTPKNRNYYASLLQRRKGRRMICSVKK